MTVPAIREVFRRAAPLPAVDQEPLQFAFQIENDAECLGTITVLAATAHSTFSSR